MKWFKKWILFGWLTDKEPTPVKTPPVVVKPPIDIELPDSIDDVPTSPGNPPAPITFNPKPNRDPNKPVVIVDIYHGDNVVDWHKLAEFADAVIIKASEHTTRKDPKFDLYRREAHKVGLLVGFYHFFRTNKSPITQANWFCDIIGKMKVGELCAVCDYETEDDANDGFDILEVEEFNNVVAKRLNINPWIYSGHILKQSGAAFKVPARFATNPLWLAHYTQSPNKLPIVPEPWKSGPGVTLHQWTESGKVPGINNPKGTDVNHFYGTYEDLLRLAVQPGRE